MKRSQFIHTLPLLTIGATLNMSFMRTLGNSLRQTYPMPVLFLGHGSPMNAIEENEFVTGFSKTGKDRIELFNDKAIGGSLTMTSVRIDQR